MSTESLSRLIARKRELLRLLKEMSRAQLELIRGGDLERLLRVLAAKQPLVNQLHAVEAELEPFRADDPERRVWKSPQARKACQEDAQICEGLLAELLELERAGETAAQERREDTARQLQTMTDASAVGRAYGALPDFVPGELDLATEM